MESIDTSNSDFRILVDEYPYKESRNLISKECVEWYTHPARKNNKIDNYLLDSEEFNSLNVSLDTKLRNGNFSFLYYRDILLGFVGLQVDGDCAWAHRLFTNPHQYKNFLGSMPTFVYPYQIEVALSKNCKKYLLTFNGKNERFYYFYRDRGYLKSTFYKSDYLSGAEQVSRFDFVGTQIVNNCDQLVISLDLDREDINDFVRY
jgi:hypothetical protein